MYGENQVNGNAIEENKNPLMNMNYFSVSDPFEMKFGGVSMGEYIEKYDFKLSDFNSYIPPSREELIKKGIAVHYLGYYVKWDPQECYYYASDNTGFKANDERTEGTYS